MAVTAVSIHGYIRATNDLDVWVKISEQNANRIVDALREFGFALETLTADLFLAPNGILHRSGILVVDQSLIPYRLVNPSNAPSRCCMIRPMRLEVAPV